MRTVVVLLALSAVAGAAEPKADVAQARAQLASLDFAGAVRLARAAVLAGGHHADELAELYAITGEAASIAEGAEAGERAFRAALVLDPSHAPPARGSPVVAEPFRRARAWVQAHGALRASHGVTVGAEGYRVRLSVDNDPLSAVAGRQLWFREAGGAFTPATLSGDTFVLPRQPGVVDYYAVLLDGAGNELLSIGDAARPLHLFSAGSVEPASPHRPLRTAAIAVGAAGLALLVTGAALNGVYASEYSHLQTVCGSSCRGDQLSQLEVSRGVSIAGYAVGAGLGATAAVLLAIDLVQARRPADGSRRAPPRPQEPPRR